MAKLVLIDLSHIFWTSFHATAGEDVDAAFRVTTQRVTSLREGYDACVICCDSGKSWRHQMFPDYKANRPQKDPAAYDQLRRVREQLEADGLPVIALENYEADDVISALATTAASTGEYEVTICTGDKDLLQLVGGPVRYASTNPKGGIYGPAEVKEKFDVTPQQLGDYLALVGDKSDNVAGCPGCGPVNAAKLLNEYGSLGEIYANLDKVTPPKIQESLREFRKQVELARSLVTLSNPPIDFAEAIKPRERKVVAPAGEAPDAEFEEDDVPAAENSGEAGQHHGHPSKEGDAPPRAPEGTDGKPPEPVAEAKSSSLVRAAEADLVFDKNDPRWAMALEPRGLKQLDWFSRKLFDSQLYRKFPNAEAIMAVILRGRSMGMDMMTALDVHNVIKGKPTMGAMAIVGRCLASGKAIFFEPVEEDDQHAIWETQRVGRPVRRHEVKFSHAVAAGLDKPSEKGEPSNWVKRPGRMLSKQAAVELARKIYPDVVANCYDPDEFE